MEVQQEIDVIKQVRDKPVLMFTDKSVSLEALTTALEKQECGVETDLGTEKGRKAIASRAFSVTKIKTAIDNAGKDLTEAKRKEIAKVDAVRRDVRTKLDELRDRIRKPLEDWEKQEEARVTDHQTTIRRLIELGQVGIDDTAETIEASLAAVAAIDVSEVAMQEFAELAAQKQEIATSHLTSALERARREEAEKAELARLRAELAERKEKEDAERAEQERKAREAEEAQRRQEAEEERRREIAEAAERAAAQARKDAEAKAEQERKDREAQEQKEREEEQARARNKAHRAEVNRKAAEALGKSCCLDAETAKSVVTAICRDQIPNVTIQY
jgi:septal ring factor EnvC (AmiA/AmiB activator)